MNKPHKHAELIKAWAGGAVIQLKDTSDNNWQNCPNPSWVPSREYRIKPAVEIPEGFTPWEGGLCPVDEKSIVEIILRRGANNRDRAGLFIWSNSDHQSDIIAYKVVKKAPVVRWQWLYESKSVHLPTYYGLTTQFFSEKEMVEAELSGIIGKAEWTRTEFDN